MVKAASLKRRSRARNEGKRPLRAHGAAAEACETLNDMLRRRDVMLSPRMIGPYTGAEVKALEADLNARIEAHRRACPYCAAPSGPLDVFA